MGIAFAILSALSMSVSNVFGKRAASYGGLVPSFVVQYGTVFALSVIAFSLFSDDGIPLSLRTLAYAAVLGTFGYAGIFAYLASSRKIPMGTSLSVAYGYVPVLFFVNAAVFPDTEALSVPKLAFAASFFATVVAFLVHSSRTKSAFLRHAWMPLTTLVCWTAYFGLSNYLVKTGFTSPLGCVVLTEGSIFSVALAAFAVWIFRTKRDRPSSRIFEGIGAKPVAFGLLMATFLVIGAGCMFASYDLIAANVTNTVGLSTIPFTSALSAVFLKERLPKSDWALILAATGCLVGFLLVP